MQIENTLNDSDPIETKSRQLPTMRDFIYKGAYIDGYDTSKNWCVAKIITISNKEEKIMVRFDGWADKWNEVFSFNSKKIAPFRRFSFDYTGGNKLAVREDYKYEFQVFEEMRKIINDMTVNDFKGYDCIQITQILRGKLFIYVDCLLSDNYDWMKEDEFRQIIDFIIDYMKMTIKYIKIFKTKTDKYLSGLINPESFLVNEDIAFAMSINEVLKVMIYIFNHNRCSLFYLKNQDLLTKLESFYPIKQEYTENIPENDSEFKHNFHLKLIELYCQNGGFSELISLLSLQKMPFNFLNIILNVLKSFTYYLKPSYKSELLISINLNLISRFKTLTDKEIKDLDKDFLTNFRENLKSLLLFLQSEHETYELLEKLELDLSLKFLNCPFFEKKLKGITELAEIIEKIDFTEKYGKNIEKYQLNDRMCHYLTKDMLYNWLIEQKIIEILFGENQHVEILKRSNDILKFLCKNQPNICLLIDQIWLGSTGKHDTILRITYELLINMAENMNKEGLTHLYNKIKSIPLEKHNEMSINFLRDFLEKSMYSVTDIDLKRLNQLESEGKLTEEILEQTYLGVSLLWSLSLDNSQISGNILENNLSHLKNCLHYSGAKPLRLFYLEITIKLILKGESIVQAIYILIGILQTLQRKNIDRESNIQRMLNSFSGKKDFISLIISDLYRYKDNIKDNKPHIDQIYEGKFSYKKNIEIRLELIEFLIEINMLNETHLVLLWQLFVIKNSEINFYFHWLIRKNDSTRNEFIPILPKQLLFAQFDIVCNEKLNSPSNINEEGFKLFKILFIHVNNIKKKLISKGSSFLILDHDLIGLNFLWILVLNCTNSIVLNSLACFLAEIHLKVVGNNDKNKKKIEIAEKFTQKCVDLLKESANDTNSNDLLNRAILLLTIFFEKFEGKYEEKDNNTKNLLDRYFDVNIILKPDDIQKELRVKFEEKLTVFRRKIADLYGFQPLEIRLIQKNSDSNSDNDDEMTLRDFGLSKTYYFYREKLEKTDNYHPKHLISESPEYLDLLFRLLSEGNADSLNNIWNLLMKLPANQKLKDNLMSLEIELKEIIDPNSFYKALYCLQIIDEFTFDKNCSLEINDYDYTNKWQNIFLKAKGLEFLEEMLFVHGNFNIHQYKRYLALLLKLIYFYQKKIEFKANFNLESLVNVILNIMNQVSMQTIVPERNLLQNTYYEEALILYYCQELLLILLGFNIKMIFLVYKYNNLLNLLINSLLLSDNNLLKDKFASGLTDLFRCIDQSRIICAPRDFFVPILINHLLDIALQNEEKAGIFFNLLIVSLDEIQKDSLIDYKAINNEYNYEIDFNILAKKILRIIREKPSLPTENQTNERTLKDLLIILKVILMREKTIMNENGFLDSLCDELIEKCLFNLKKNQFQVKCRSELSKKAGFEVLEMIGVNNQVILNKIMEFVRPLHINCDWRTKSYSDWNIAPKLYEKSYTGYVGLKNLGCICYMNSLIQQLYMIPSFRKFVIEADDNNFQESTKEDNLLYQLQCMFLSLQLSDKQFFNPKFFCNAFKDWEGNPTNIFEQRDVDEFSNMLLDKLETSISNTSESKAIKNHFGGVLTNEFICKDCPHSSEREEPFLAVNLQVKNKKSIEESLASFVEGELLEGQNAYLCEQCNKKVTAIKRICLKKLPNHLILVLKRFEFDYDNMSKLKINEVCEFPTFLNLEKYTQMGIKKSENKMDEELDQTYFEYQLKGIVIHMGNADSGHYYSLIEERDGKKKWHEFNDTIVKYFDPRDIPNEAFGGEEKFNYYGQNNQNFMMNYKEKIKNAYMLFYDRIIPKNENIQEEETKDVEKKIDQTESKIIENRLASKQALEKFKQETIENNYKFYIHKNVFCQEYFDFLMNLITERQYLPNLSLMNVPFIYEEQSDYYYDLELLKIGFAFLMTTVLRDKDHPNILKIYPFIQSQLTQNLPFALWVLNVFSNRSIIEEFLLYCPIPDMRKITIGLIKTCFRFIYEQINKSLEEKNILFNFISILIAFVGDIGKKYTDTTEFFRLFYCIAKVSNEISFFMLKNNLIYRFCLHVMGNQEINKFPQDLEYKESQDFLMGEPKESLKRRLIKLDEQKRTKKERFSIENYSNSNRCFMWRTISELLKYCTKKNCIWNKGYDSFDLPENEYFLLISGPDNIFQVINEANNKVSVKAISVIFAYLAFDNIHVTGRILDTIFNKGFSRRETQEFRPFFGIIKKMIQFNVNCNNELFEYVLGSFANYVNEHKNQAKDIIYFQDFILKLANKYEKVVEYYYKNPTLINWVMQWITETEVPHIKEIITIHILPYNRFRHPKTYQGYYDFAKEKILKFQKILKNEFEKIEDDWDSDDDCLETDLEIGDKLDYYVCGMREWFTAKVEKTLDDLINITIFLNDNSNNNIWISKECDDLSPYQKMQELTEREGELLLENENNLLNKNYIELETKDSTELNVGSNAESENEQQLIQNHPSSNENFEDLADNLADNEQNI